MSSYQKYPYEIPESLVERHGRAGCHTKASKLGIARGLRNPGADLSTLTEAELGYIAGFMDGEGSILISETGKLNPTLQFPNTHRAAIEWLQRKLTVGGLAITVRSKATAVNPHYKDLYQLHIGGALNVYSILKAILPYLIIKKEKAERAIRILETKYSLQSFHNNLS